MIKKCFLSFFCLFFVFLFSAVFCLYDLMEGEGNPMRGNRDGWHSGGVECLAEALFEILTILWDPCCRHSHLALRCDTHGSGKRSIVRWGSVMLIVGPVPVNELPRVELDRDLTSEHGLCLFLLRRFGPHCPALNPHGVVACVTLEDPTRPCEATWPEHHRHDSLCSLCVG